MNENFDITHLRKLAATGHPDALYRLANQLVIAGMAEEAFSIHERAATAGHPHAQVECARMLMHGIGTDASTDTAARWLASSERQGNTVASYHLALMKPTDEHSSRRLLAAVNAGYLPAILATAIHFGRRQNQDDQALCLQLLRLAAESGHKIAAQLLAERLKFGEGCDTDENAAEHLISQLDAAGAMRTPRIKAPAAFQTGISPGEIDLRDMLATPPRHQLSPNPRISAVTGLLSADECRFLVASSISHLEHSKTVDPVTGNPQKLAIRTSRSVSHDPITEDLTMRIIQHRIAAVAGIGLVNAESLVVLHYAPGEEYKPHRDYLPPGAIQRDIPSAGNRLRTVCAYLNDVESGGETHFPLLGITSKPMCGSAVIFDNLDADGHPDPRTLHAGLPVKTGEKWLATLWFRQHQYRTF